MRSLKAQLMSMVSGKSEKPRDSIILPDSATDTDTDTAGSTSLYGINHLEGHRSPGSIRTPSVRYDGLCYYVKNTASHTSANSSANTPHLARKFGHVRPRSANRPECHLMAVKRARPADGASNDADATPSNDSDAPSTAPKTRASADAKRKWKESWMTVPSVEQRQEG